MEAANPGVIRLITALGFRFMLSISKITNSKYAARLHDILNGAFMPFRKDYTDRAFAATVVSEEIITNRIASEQYTVYGAFVNAEIAGTVTTKLTEDGQLYFMSMGVSPSFAGQGIGRELVKRIEEEALARQARCISLETYEVLLQAIKLYENCGFRRTGKKRDYSGIEIFEMKKDVSTIDHVEK